MIFLKQTIKQFFKIIFILLLLNCVSQTFASSSKLIKLDENSWTQLLKGEWMVEFYAPWCPACKHLEPQWKQFSSWSDDLSIKVANIDVTTNPGLSGRFMVTALPTIYHVKDGVFRQYKGSRQYNAFVAFVEERKWETIEPISAWKSPNSIQMSILSYFFKLSMALRSVHNKLIEEYGLPSWGSYFLFGLSTIFLGTILGIVIIVIIDIIFPYRQSTSKIFEKKEKSSNLIENTQLSDQITNKEKVEEKTNEDEKDKEIKLQKESKKDS